MKVIKNTNEYYLVTIRDNNYQKEYREQITDLKIIVDRKSRKFTIMNDCPVFGTVSVRDNRIFPRLLHALTRTYWEAYVMILLFKNT